MVEPILAFEDLTLGYERHPAVHHLNGRITAGTLLAIVGPNGGGKSTLLKGISGRLSPLSGRIINQFPRMAYMPQVGDLNRDFPVTVFDLALTGLCGRRGMFGGFHAANGIAWLIHSLWWACQGSSVVDPHAVRRATPAPALCKADPAGCAADPAG